MDEARWLSSEDPRKLLEWQRGAFSERKLRLFVCAFWRQFWQEEIGILPETESDPALLQVLAYAEQWAEQGVRPERMSFPLGFGWHPLVALNAFDGANWTIRQTAGFKGRLDCYRYDAKDRHKAADQQIRLLREIAGNPYRTITIDPSWRTPTVVALAHAVYDTQAFQRLPVLADALEDAGCDNEEMLIHCRISGSHVRGCWLIDLLTGRE
jgi:hypothetical protein